MLSELIVKENINIVDKVSSWEDAIKTASEPLLEKNFISKEYVDTMINNTKELGPYFIVAPKIAIPHARPENGVNKLGMSLLKINQEIGFSDKEEHLANIVIVLAAEDNNSHLKALTQLTELLSNEDDTNSLLQATSIDDALKIIKKY